MTTDRFPRVPPQVTEAQLTALTALLTVTDTGALVNVTDGTQAGLRQWTGTAFNRLAGNNLPTIKEIFGITDDSGLTNAAPPTGVRVFSKGTPSNGQTIALSADDATNWGGLWVYNTSGAWTRATGYESGVEIANFSLFSFGVANGYELYRLFRGPGNFFKLGISFVAVEFHSLLSSIYIRPEGIINEVRAYFTDDSLTLDGNSQPTGAAIPVISYDLLNGTLVAVSATALSSNLGGLWIYNTSGTWTRYTGWEMNTFHSNNTLFSIVSPTQLHLCALRSGQGDIPYYYVGDTDNNVSLIASIPLTGGGGSGLTHPEVMARQGMRF
jgi:hypothetical protein